MNMFARFDENPAMTLQDIKETKRYGQTHTRTDVKTVYPPRTKFVGGITKDDFCRLPSFHLKYLGCLYCKQYGPRSECSSV